MFSKFPYIVYLNEAEEGEDLGGADRGDDFDPALFEEEDHGAGKPTAGKEAEGKEGDKDAEAGKEGDKDAEALKEGDKEGDKKDGEKEPRKPSRAEKRIQQLNERNAALEKQLAERMGSERIAKDIADLETRAVQLEKDYHKALGEDPEKAAALMRQIRQVDRDIARIEAAAEAEAAVNEKLEKRDLNAAIDELTEKYPQLLKGHEEFDQELVNEINAVYTGLISISANKAAAMRRAVKMIMGDQERAPAGLGEESKGDKVRDQRKEEGVRRTVDTVNRQPPSVENVGKSSPAAGIAAVKSIKDLEKLSEEELAKARGDEVA